MTYGREPSSGPGLKASKRLRATSERALPWLAQSQGITSKNSHILDARLRPLLDP